MQAKRRAAAEVFTNQQAAKVSAPPLAPRVDMADEFMAEIEEDVMAGAPPRQAPAAPYRPPSIVSSEELQLEKEPLKVQEKGWGLWKRVIVPPNAYVVHTRLGRSEPVTLGLGLSFRYNPFRDAYLIVPAAMQTIGVVANCISKEKQGINILAYLQWQIADFAVAYRKLDFSDSRDPLGVVNAQLREQAEAAIKDKIATMIVEEVLTDKAPVIQELTARLKQVAEGGEQAGEGLGIKIVTVQIREALVSSTKLWQDLQAPFRHQQEKNARISYLEMQHQIRQKELDTRRITEISQAETLLEIEQAKQAKQTETLDVQLTEETKRRDKQQAADQHQAEIEQARELAALQRGQQRLQAEAQLKQQQAELDLKTQAQADQLKAVALEAELARQGQSKRAELAWEEASQGLQHAAEEKRAALFRQYQEARNLVQDPALRQSLIEQLPAIAQAMPDIQELRVLQTSDSAPGLEALTGFVARMLALAEGWGSKGGAG